MGKIKQKEHPLQGTYSHLLENKEKLKFAYSAGLYTILLTNTRVILKKNISHSLINFRYKDIEVVEYVTNPKWLFLIVSFLFFVSCYVFFVIMPGDGSMTLMNVRLSSGEIYTTQTNMNTILFKLVGFVSFTFGFYFLFSFVMSLFGHLKFFLVSKKRSISILCKFSEETPEIINHIENQKYN